MSIVQQKNNASNLQSTAQECYDGIYGLLRGYGMCFSGPIEETGSVPIKFAGREGSRQKSEWVYFNFKNEGILVTFGSHHSSLPEKVTRLINYGGSVPGCDAAKACEIKALQEKHHAISKERIQEEEKQKAAQRDRALGIYMRASNSGVNKHPYLVKKRLEHTYELRLIDYSIKGVCYSAVVVPIYDFKHSIQAVQLIFAQKIDFGGEKLRDKHTVGPIGGCFYLLGQLAVDRLFVLCEGVATGLSIFESKFFTTLCCLSCTNYLRVVDDLLRRFPSAQVIVACDNDVGTVGNPGVSHAKKIKEKYPSIKLLIPPATAGIGTDFSDLFMKGGDR